MRVDGRWVVAGIAGLGFLALLARVPRGLMPRADRQAKLGSAGPSGPSPTADPCAHLNGMRMCCPGLGEVGDVSVMASKADAIAKVRISEVGIPMFSTRDGHVPPDGPPTGPEDDDQPDPKRIFSLVVLEATHVYSGTPVTGYVVIRDGGVSPECPEFTYLGDLEPEGQVGDVGVIELITLDGPSRQEPPPAIQHLLARAEALNAAPDVRYEPMLLWAWYRYSGQRVLSRQLVTPMPIDLLEIEIERLSRAR